MASRFWISPIPTPSHSMEPSRCNCTPAAKATCGSRIFISAICPCADFLSMTSRKAAVDRGLRFIFEHSLAGENFDYWAGDYLWCFLCISRTAIDPELRLSAREMGAHSAKRWYARENQLPALADAGEVAYYISLLDVASRLGVDDEGLRGHIRQRYRDFTTRDYLGFDPTEEAPP